MVIDLEAFAWCQQKVNKDVLEELKELTKMVAYLNKRVKQLETEKGQHENFKKGE